MRRRVSRSARPFRLLALAAVLGVLQLNLAPPADSATVCTTDAAHDWTGGVWHPDTGHFAAAINAPITLRYGATLCLNIAHPDAWSDWIAMEPGDGSKIVQIGFTRLVTDWNTNQIQYCRFWAIHNGDIHAYHCGGDNGGDQVYFKIQAQGSGQQYYYSIFDCGISGGYGDCVLKDADQIVWFDAFGLIASEVSYKCGDHMSGATGSRSQYGNSVYPIKGQNEIGSTWIIRDWTSFGQDHCSSYENNVTDSQIQTWDSRN